MVASKPQGTVDRKFMALVSAQARDSQWCPLGHKGVSDCPRFTVKCDGINCASGFSAAERAKLVKEHGYGR